jgi:dTDP-glucose 4,6-dehydratase
MQRILVTGGAGFIGSHFVRHLLTRYDYQVTNLDKLTYAGNPDNLRDVEGHPRYRFVQGDIADPKLVRRLIGDVDAVVNFAAETHVDRSLIEAGAFIRTDVLGTYVLLEAARQSGIERFLHISTDEVYGEAPAGRSFKEDDPLHPRSPYAASKAGADMQCLAFVETYELPVVIARPSNNLGPNQHPEKAIPLFVTNALDDQPLPIYGDGRQVRDWLFVGDNCEALDLLLHEGRPGHAYNVSARQERENLQVTEGILDVLGKPRSLMRLVEDRPGHDRRYSLDAAKLRALGWRPRHSFEEALEKTVRWYADNRWWWEKIKAGDFHRYYEENYRRRLERSRQA